MKVSFSSSSSSSKINRFEDEDEDEDESEDNQSTLIVTHYISFLAEAIAPPLNNASILPSRRGISTGLVS